MPVVALGKKWSYFFQSGFVLFVSGNVERACRTTLPSPAISPGGCWTGSSCLPSGTMVSILAADALTIQRTTTLNPAWFSPRGGIPLERNPAQGAHSRLREPRSLVEVPGLPCRPRSTLRELIPGVSLRKKNFFFFFFFFFFF